MKISTKVKVTSLGKQFLGTDRLLRPGGGGGGRWFSKISSVWKFYPPPLPKIKKKKENLSNKSFTPHCNDSLKILPFPPPPPP